MTDAASTSTGSKRGLRYGGATFSLSHRLRRAAWRAAWTLTARWTPPPLHRWRAFVLGVFGARVAKTARVYPSAVVWLPANLTIGEHACIGPGVICYDVGPIVIGDFAIVSQRAHLCAGTHDCDDEEFPLQARPISIGANAWIAAEAFVGPGVSVGEGAVLGARGVATRDLAPWTIHAGNPARFIRPRRRWMEPKAVTLSA